MSLPENGDTGLLTESDHTPAFRQCAVSHGLRLYRLYLPAGSRPGLEATLTFDCPCGKRWLMRVEAGGVVSAGEIRKMPAAVERPADDTLSLPADDATLPTLEEVERLHILRVLEHTKGNRSQAARILDVDPKTLYNKMKVYLQRTP